MNRVIDFKGLDHISQVDSKHKQDMCIADKSEIALAKDWLKAALHCEAFKWDGDQYECAMKSLEYLEWLVDE